MESAEIVKRAARITWQGKSLWPFGIALALFARSAPAFGGMRHLIRVAGAQRIVPHSGDQLALTLAALFAIAGVLSIAMRLVAVIVRYTSTGALIEMAAQADQGGDTMFSAGLKQGWKGLLRLVLIALTVFVAALAAALVVMVCALVIAGLFALPALPMIPAGGGWRLVGIVWVTITGVALVAILLLGAVALSGALTVVTELAFRSVLLGKAGTFGAIGKAIALLRGHLGECAWVWIVLGLARLALGLVMSFAAAIAGAAMVAPALGLWRMSGMPLLPVPLIAPALVLGIAFLTVVKGVFLAFQSVTWTLVYRELEPSAEA